MGFLSPSILRARVVRGALPAVALAFWAAQASPAAADAANGVLRVGTSFSCSSLNPYTTVQSSCLAALRLMYPSLGQASGTDVVPDLAESWTSDETGLVWTFKIRNGQWSDGEPLTAGDAAFTINMLLKHVDGPTARRARSIGTVEKAEAPDDSTLVVTFKQPTANAVGRLAQVLIVPEHIWGPLAEGDGAAITTFTNDPPVVGGPFKLARFTADQIILLEPYEDYFGEAPALKGVGIQFFTDSTAMVQALVNNQLDVVTPLPVTSVEAVKKAGITVANYPGLRFHSWLFNSSENQKAFPEIRDIKLREAFAHAIDRKKIAEVAYLGFATPGDSMVPKVTGFWSNPNIQSEPFDLDLANKLLDEAGYTKGADGWRVANGHKMSYKVLIPANVEGAEGLRALEIVTEDFKKIGVELVTVQSDNATISEAITGPNNTFAESTIAQWGWIPQMDPDFILSVVLCSQIGGLSETAYCNEEYDALYEQQAKEVDTEKRKEIVWKMQEILQRDRPYIVTVQQNNVEAVAPGWTGFIENPIGFLDYTSNQTFLSMRPES